MFRASLLCCVEILDGITEECWMEWNRVIGGRRLYEYTCWSPTVHGILHSITSHVCVQRLALCEQNCLSLGLGGFDANGIMPFFVPEKLLYLQGIDDFVALPLIKCRCRSLALISHTAHDNTPRSVVGLMYVFHTCPGRGLGMISLRNSTSSTEGYYYNTRQFVRLIFM